MKTVDDYIQKNYGECDDRVKTFLSRVFEDCKKNNDKLTNYFYCTLDLLKNALVLYYLALDAIEADKQISKEDNYKRISRSPSVGIMQKQHGQILDILDKLGLSPFATAKIKRLNKSNDDGESAEELLNTLIN